MLSHPPRDPALPGPFSTARLSRIKTHVRHGLSAMAASLGLVACSAMPAHFNAAAVPPSILLATAEAGITDGRGRFRELFDAVANARGAQLPDARPMDGKDALWRLAGEPAGAGTPVSLGKSTAGLTVLIVPGLLAECVADKSKAFEDGVANLQAQGYKTGYIQTRGRQSSERNAGIVRDAILARPESEKIILVTHSKGTVDSLEALVAFPELTRRVLAVVSVAGAVNGSPIADVVPQSLVELAESLKLSSCAKGQGTEAVDSLRRPARLRWLATHPLPPAVRYYSLAAFAKPEDISAILKPFYAVLSRTDPLNDSLVLCSDAIIPGSTLLGYPNADHLAVAMPFAQKNPFLAATLLTKNHYPRAVLLEAAIRYVEEDLQAHPASAP